MKQKMFTTLAGLLAAGLAWAGPIQLSDACPPSFEKTATGVCELRNMYQFYDSLQDRGVGGTKTALPAHRDGFTPQQIDLGRYLFFDPVLSVDGTVSCASCHDPDKGFADGLGRSIGVAGHEVARSAPTLWNVAFLQSFFGTPGPKPSKNRRRGPCMRLMRWAIPRPTCCRH